MMSVAGVVKLAKRWAFYALPPRLELAMRRAYYPRRLRRSSMDEEPELQVLKELVNRGDVVCDIGANIGFYTYWLSRMVADEGVVYSFEPVPPVFDFLKHNVNVLELNNVNARCLALSDHAGTARMVVPSYEAGGRNFYMSHLVEQGREADGHTCFEVSTQRLDDMMPDVGDGVALLKCDVEGHELACLSGSMEVIRRSRPALLVELCDDIHTVGAGAQILAGKFAEIGYRPFVCETGGITEQLPGIRAVNTFFLQDSHIERLRSRGLKVRISP